MLIVISPAKNVDFKTPPPISLYSQPDFVKSSKILIHRLFDLSARDLAKLFNVNPSIAQLNYERYRSWRLPFTLENAKQAAFAFNGEVYNGLKAKTLSVSNIEYAQDHLRILSGLYGVLRPLDLIQPYRLEMGIPLDTENANNLYEFWGDRITKAIAKAIKHSGDEQVLINLSSHEYFKSVQRKKLKARVIDIEFNEMKNGKFKPIIVYTKKARGMMARFIIENKIGNPEELKLFDVERYGFAEELSTENKWVFVR
ncbi:MAG: peroxide stress protein YaaA [Bacteroidales bacterium]|nr:peroxide stress protein YaaA [Bacteroidales bacterium]